LRKLCSEKNISYPDLVRRLNQVAHTAAPGPDLEFHKWKTDFLIDYIINVHHAHLRQLLPKLEGDLHDFVLRHPGKYAPLQSAAPVFAALAASMTKEFEEQENVLFPYIKQLYSAHRRREPYGKLLVQTLRKPMNKTAEDAGQLSERLDTIRRLLNNYHADEGMCTGYDVLAKRLHDFDSNLVLHKHLENNILFPAAVQMEQELLTT
jgi:regulator of cell morphogenesis and NO signaling